MGASDAAAAEPLLAASGRGDADAAQARAANGARSNGVDADPESNSTPPPAHLAAWGESLATETRRVLALTGPAVASGMLSFASYLITTAQVSGALQLMLAIMGKGAAHTARPARCPKHAPTHG